MIKLFLFIITYFLCIVSLPGKITLFPLSFKICYAMILMFMSQGANGYKTVPVFLCPATYIHIFQEDFYYEKKTLDTWSVLHLWQRSSFFWLTHRLE